MCCLLVLECRFLVVRSIGITESGISEYLALKKQSNQYSALVYAKASMEMLVSMSITVCLTHPFH